MRRKKIVANYFTSNLLEFESKSTKDYHEKFNTEVFENYFEPMIELILEKLRKKKWFICKKTVFQNHAI